MVLVLLERCNEPAASVCFSVWCVITGVYVLILLVCTCISLGQLYVYICIFGVSISVALKLNADNMSMVLDKAGIKEAADVASALGLSQSLGQWYKSLFGVQSWAAVLAMWKEQESYVSWSKLAEAVQRIHGVDSSQIILEISGEGNIIYSEYSMISTRCCVAYYVKAFQLLVRIQCATQLTLIYLPHYLSQNAVVQNFH